MNVKYVVLKNKLIHSQSVRKSHICLIEEMSELTKVLTKIERLKHGECLPLNDLCEEIGHVLLMCDIVKETHYLNSYDILTHQIKALEKGISYNFNYGCNS